MEKMKFGETNPEIYLMKKALAKAGAFAFSIVSLNPAHRLCERLLHSIEKKRGQDQNPAPFKIQYPMKNQIEDYIYQASFFTF